MFILPNLPKHQVNLLPFWWTIVIGLVIYISPFLSSWLENIQEKQAIDFASIIDRESDAESLSTSWDLSPVLKQYFWENEIVTYKSLLPVLREKYDGEFRSQNVDFSYITKESVLYPSFAYAFQMWMIWAGLDPDLSVKCKNLMVILWLAESWILDYTSENIIQNFWDTSQSKWLLENWCSSLDTVVLGKMLP